jgi:iron complex outermembrane receptor protein
MRTKFLAAILLAALVALPLAAQGTGRITGRVLDSEGRGIAGVTVTAVELGRAELSDSQGAFAFNDVPAGTYTLEFTLADFTASQTGVTVSEGQPTEVSKQVDWMVSLAETITVFSASRQAERITEAPAAVSVITAEEIGREAAHGQLPKLLEFTPGAEVTQSGVYDYNFNTRGFNSSLNRRVATLVDGRDPSVPFLGAQEWAAVNFPLDDLAQAELVRGPSAALYGANAASGVLNLITKRPRDSQGGLVRLTAGELSTLNADLRWAGEIAEPWYFKVLAGTRQSGDFTVSRQRHPLLKPQGTAEYSVPCPLPQGAATDCLPQELVTLNPEDDDEINFGSARVDRHFADDAVLTFEGGTADVSGPVFQTGIGRVQLVDVKRLWGRTEYSQSHFNIMGSYNNREADRQTALGPGVNLALDDENWKVEGQTNWDFAGDRGRIVAGVSYEEESIDSLDPSGPARPTLSNPQNRQTLVFRPIDADFTALYAQFDWDLTEALKLTLAGRHDDSSLHDSQFSPKASLVWSFQPSHSLRLTYNEAFQVANYSEFYLQADVAGIANLSPFENFCRLQGVPCGFDFDNNPATGHTRVLALGNEDLELEEVKTAEIGYTGIFANRAFVSLDYYNSENENFITDLIPQLGTAFGRINPNFGPYQPPAGMSPAAQAQLLAILRASLPASTFAILSNNLDGTPILAAVSYTNFGTVDTEGIDFGFDWYNGPWKVSGTYSWFDFEIQDSQPGFDRILLPNSPENKLSAGLAYVVQRWDAGMSYRWVDDFRWSVGPFQGDVPSYGTADVTANWHLNDHWSLGVNVANAFDDEHWESFGGDLLARRALGHVTFRW